VNKSDLSHLANSETKISINKYKGQTHIYIDGSKDPDSDRVASAVVIPSLQFQNTDRLTNNTPIYTAELLAIKNVMCRINGSNINKAVIFSDPLSSLISLKSNNSQSIYLIKSFFYIIKVPTFETSYHCLADRTAKMGLNLNIVTVSISLSPTEVYAIIKNI
jgi:hypothetical protein